MTFQYQGRRIEVVPLDSKVLVVAAEGFVTDWAAYIGAVAGEDHDREWLDVLFHGNKLPERVAKAIFQGEPWKYLDWRD
jgi:hypothetical protein